MYGTFDCLILKTKPTFVGFAEFGSHWMFPPPAMAGEELDVKTQVKSNSMFVSYIARKLGQACRPINPVKQISFETVPSK